MFLLLEHKLTGKIGLGKNIQNIHFLRDPQVQKVHGPKNVASIHSDSAPDRPPAQSSILERIPCFLGSQLWLSKNRFLHSYRQIKCVLHAAYGCIPTLLNHTTLSTSKRQGTLPTLTALITSRHRFTKCPNHISLAALELVNDDLLTMSLERIILQQIFVIFFWGVAFQTTMY